MWWGGGGLLGLVLGWQAAVAAVLIGLCLAYRLVRAVSAGWGVAGRSGWWFRAASLALPIAAVIAIGWWRQLLWAAASWFAHSILVASAGTLFSRHELL